MLVRREAIHQLPELVKGARAVEDPSAADELSLMALRILREAFGETSVSVLFSWSQQRSITVNTKATDEILLSLKALKRLRCWRDLRSGVRHVFFVIDSL